jgi:hypothetical protein
MVISGRSALGRRIKDLADAYAERLGGWSQLTDLETAAVRRAAEMTALAEAERTRRLAGETNTTIDDLVRIDRLAAQTVRALDIYRRREPRPPSALDALLPDPEGDDD